MGPVRRFRGVFSSAAFLLTLFSIPLHAVEIEQRQYDAYVTNTGSLAGYRIFLAPQYGYVILHGDIAIPVQIPPQTVGIYGTGLPTSIYAPANSVPSDLFTAFTYKASVNYWGDFNGDGKTDLFVYMRDYEPNRAYIIYGGTTSNTTVTLADNSNLYDFSTSTFSIRDINGDGIPDVVFTSADGVEYAFVMDPQYSGAYQEITSAMLVDTPEQAVTDVGITAGDFKVSQGGSAQYTISVMTGASAGNVKPSVSLSYDSAAGNGLAGWGWNLNAGSAISRCRKKPVGTANWQPIAFNETDAYCLDGQELILETPGGSVYRTEIDSYRKITRSGSAASPLYWVVQAKDGSSSYYGLSNSAQNLSSSGKILSWAINRMQDSATNNVDYEYSLIGNNLRLDRIKYGGNVNASVQPSNSIEFEYSKRADSSKSYLAGYEIASSYRLERIRSLVNGYELRSYHLNYLSGNINNTESLVSRLASLQECVGAKCLKPTKFAWEYPKPKDMAFTTDWWQDSDGYIGGGTTLDIDGDGRRDVLLPRVGDSKWLVVKRSNGVALEHMGECRLHNDDGFDRYSVIDYNGDGHDDVIESSGDSSTWRVWLSRFSNGAWRLDCANSINTGANDYGGQSASFSDFNGDGMLDLVRPVVVREIVVGYEIQYLTRSGFHNSTELPYSFSPPVAVSLTSLSVTLTNTATIKPKLQDATLPSGTTYVYVALGEKAKQAMDFNGDGRADLLAPVMQATLNLSGTKYVAANKQILGWVALVSKGASEFKQYYWTPAAFANDRIHTADFNGDGLSDLLYRNVNSPTEFGWYVGLNNGNGGFPAVTVLLNAEIPGDPSSIGLFDMSGDGNADIVAFDQYGSTHVFSLTGTGFMAKAYATNIAKPTWPIWGDFNADGQMDALTWKGEDDQYFLYIRGPGFQPNVIDTITNGFGAKTEISYLPMTSPYVYIMGTGANQLDYGGAPVLDIMAPSYLVSRVKSSAPSAGAAAGSVNQSAMAEVGYAYAGARLQGSGRGQLGFQKITTFDYQNDIQTDTVYYQNFPFIGLPLSTSQQKMSGSKPVLSQALNDWRIVGSNAAPYRINLYAAVETSYDTDIAAPASTKLFKTVTTIKENIDTWGNPGKITVTTVGGGHSFKQITENSYSTDAEYQRLGRVVDVTTTSTIDDANAITRKSHFDYYPTGTARAYLLWKETLASDKTTATTTEYEYDDFGNKTKVIRKGRDGLPDRYSRYVYSSDGRYLEQTLNSYDQVVESVVERDNYGRATQVADIDGLSSYLAFDAFGREIERRRDYGGTTTTSYNFCYWDCSVSPYYVLQQSNDGSSSLVVLDILGRETLSQSNTLGGEWISVFTEYDIRSKVKRKSQPVKGNGTKYWNEVVYDDIGRVQTEFTAGAGVSDITHQYGVVNFFGNDIAIHSVTNDKPQTTTTFFDALGREVIVGDAKGGTLSNTYDALGNLKKVDLVAIGPSGTSEGRTVEMSYNELGQRDKLIDPDKGTLCFWYNAFGEEKKQVRVTDQKRYTGSCGSVAIANSQTIETEYDKLGRATRKTYKRGAATAFEYDFKWTYDNSISLVNSIGKLTKSQDAVSGYIENYSYEAGSHKLSSTDYLLPDGQLFNTSVQYDSLGRVNTTTDAAGGTVQNTYDTFSGILKSVRDVGSNKVYYEVTGTDAFGHTTTAQFTQAGVTLSRAYSAETGRLQSIAATDVLAGTLQSIAVNWDIIGNLQSRTERITSSTNKSEYYCYDNLNRLIKTSTATVNCATLTLASQTYEYDGFGGITRNGTNAMLYEKTGNAGPNAATKFGTNVYSYDMQGNLLTDVKAAATQRSFAYNLMDKPTQITQSTNSTQFSYGPSGSYYKRVDVRSGQPTTTTFYVGGIEIVRNGTSLNERTKRYITGDIVIETEENSSGAVVSNRQYYLLRDHLGSVHKVLEPNASGSIAAEQMSFDAFGKRRDVADFTALAYTATDATYWTNIVHNYNRRTSIGYTGHQEVDLGSPDQGLIHMGGRMYDPTIGRFLSADPIVQAPSDLQSYNRYAYVRNNPLVLTDPSGYSWWGEHVTPHGEQVVRTVVAAVIAYFTGYYANGFLVAGGNYAAAAAAGTAAVGGYAAGYVATGSGQGGLRGAFTAVAFFGVGQAVHSFFDAGNLADVGTNAFNAGDFIAATTLHGLVGGVIEDLYGGNFGHGFLGAFINKAAAGPIDTATGENVAFGATVSAVVGGVVSEATGGKFANGAATAAMAFLFNETMDATKNKLPDGVKTKSDSVKIDNLDSAISDKLSDIKTTYTDQGISGDVVITSGNDGKHGTKSLHYKDKAIDIRSNSLSDANQVKLANALQTKLGDKLTVISEHFTKKAVNHIHIEVDTPIDSSKASVYKESGLKRTW